HDSVGDLPRIGVAEPSQRSLSLALVSRFSRRLAAHRGGRIGRSLPLAVSVFSSPNQISRRAPSILIEVLSVLPLQKCFFSENLKMNGHSGHRRKDQKEPCPVEQKYSDEE